MCHTWLCGLSGWLCHQHSLSEIVISRLFLFYEIELFVKASNCKYLVTLHQTLCLKGNPGNFLGGMVDKNPPANVWDTGLIPGPGSSHMPRSNLASVPKLLSLCSRAWKPWLLSPCVTTTEACAPRACALQQWAPPRWEVCTSQLGSDVTCHTRDSLSMETKTQHSHKINIQ